VDGGDVGGAAEAAAAGHRVRAVGGGAPQFRLGLPRPRHRARCWLQRRVRQRLRLRERRRRSAVCAGAGGDAADAGCWVRREGDRQPRLPACRHRLRRAPRHYPQRRRSQRRRPGAGRDGGAGGGDAVCVRRLPPGRSRAQMRRCRRRSHATTRARHHPRLRAAYRDRSASGSGPSI